MARAEAVIAAARGWIGTPYLHQASLKGVGTDCLGLVRGVWREVMGAEPEAPPPYAPGWAEMGGGEAMAEAARQATCCCFAGGRSCRPSMPASPCRAMRWCMPRKRPR